jgi:hypothetical protein
VSKLRRRIARRGRDGAAGSPDERCRRSAGSSATRTRARPTGAPAPGRFATLRIDGPLDGVVTLTATPHNEIRVDASWHDGAARERLSVICASEPEALIRANELVEALAARRPPRSRDSHDQSSARELD